MDTNQAIYDMIGKSRAKLYPLQKGPGKSFRLLKTEKLKHAIQHPDKDGRYVTASTLIPWVIAFLYTDIAINSYGKIISMKNYNPDSSLLKTVVNTYYKQIWCGGFIKDSGGKTIFSTSIANERWILPVWNGRSTHTTFLTPL
ncbi:MAG: hypothetical protein IPP43_00890 [Chitinophagaceae bacterium]|nr:hypothetical protein [Chitinophagaceae bacterium]